MHYVRCLRSPKLAIKGRSVRVDLLFTVTTDLGDSFLIPETPIKLFVTVHLSASPEKILWKLSEESQILWTPGQRVAKPCLQLPTAAAEAFLACKPLQIRISAGSQFSAESAEGIIARSLNKKPQAEVSTLR